MQDIGCIFHGGMSSDFPVVFTENGFTARKCPRCNLIFVSPRPSLKEISNLYGHNEADEYARRYVTEGFSRRLYAKHALSILKRHAPNGSILDVGAGAGYFLDEARRYGYQVFGIEMNPIEAEFMKSSLRIDCETSPIHETYKDMKFEVVSTFNVLSHLYDPIADFQAMSERLKKSGIMLIETGNLAEVRSAYYGHYGRFLLPNHLFFFGEESLRLLLRDCKLDIVEIRRFSILPQIIIAGPLRWLVKKLLQMPVSTQKESAPTVEHAANGGELDMEVAGNDCYGSSPSAISGGGGGHLQFLSTRLSPVLVNGKSLLWYLLRTSVGGWLARKGTPQTVIVVARKR
jgi:2-polyprenyl-3-methyl-5-hydroxy-6-metoxy-1,4-benzoquinol methylase